MAELADLLQMETHAQRLALEAEPRSDYNEAEFARALAAIYTMILRVDCTRIDPERRVEDACAGVCPEEPRST